MKLTTIVIRGCWECPNVRYITSNFGNCGKNFLKELPKNANVRGIGVIPPTWCPLEDYIEEKE